MLLKMAVAVAMLLLVADVSGVALREPPQSSSFRSSQKVRQFSTGTLYESPYKTIFAPSSPSHYQPSISGPLPGGPSFYSTPTQLYRTQTVIKKSPIRNPHVPDDIASMNPKYGNVNINDIPVISKPSNLLPAGSYEENFSYQKPFFENDAEGLAPQTNIQSETISQLSNPPVNDEISGQHQQPILSSDIANSLKEIEKTIAAAIETVSHVNSQMPNTAIHLPKTGELSSVQVGSSNVANRDVSHTESTIISEQSEAQIQVPGVAVPPTKSGGQVAAAVAPPTRSGGQVPAAIAPPTRTEGQVPAAVAPPTRTEGQVPAAVAPPTRSGGQVPAAIAPPTRTEGQVPAAVAPPTRTESQVPAAVAPPTRTESQVPAAIAPPTITESQVPAAIAPPTKTESQVPAAIAPPNRTESLVPAAIAPPTRTESQVPAAIAPPTRTETQASAAIAPPTISHASTPTGQHAVSIGSSNEIKGQISAVIPKRTESDQIPSAIIPPSRTQQISTAIPAAIAPVSQPSNNVPGSIAPESETHEESAEPIEPAEPVEEIEPDDVADAEGQESHSIEVTNNGNRASSVEIQIKSSLDKETEIESEEDAIIPLNQFIFNKPPFLSHNFEEKEKSRPLSLRVSNIVANDESIQSLAAIYETQNDIPFIFSKRDTVIYNQEYESDSNNLTKDESTIADENELMTEASVIENNNNSTPEPSVVESETPSNISDVEYAPPSQTHNTLIAKIESDPKVLDAKYEYLLSWNEAVTKLGMGILRIANVYPDNGYVFMPEVENAARFIQSIPTVRNASEKLNLAWQDAKQNLTDSIDTNSTVSSENNATENSTDHTPLRSNINWLHDHAISIGNQIFVPANGGQPHPFYPMSSGLGLPYPGFYPQFPSRAPPGFQGATRPADQINVIEVGNEQIPGIVQDFDIADLTRPNIEKPSKPNRHGSS